MKIFDPKKPLNELPKLPPDFNLDEVGGDRNPICS